MNNLYVSTTFIKDGKKIKMALDIFKSARVENVEIGSNCVAARDIQANSVLIRQMLKRIK